MAVDIIRPTSISTNVCVWSGLDLRLSCHTGIGRNNTSATAIHGYDDGIRKKNLKSADHQVMLNLKDRFIDLLTDITDHLGEMLLEGCSQN